MVTKMYFKNRDVASLLSKLIKEAPAARFFATAHLYESSL